MEVSTVFLSSSFFQQLVQLFAHGAPGQPLHFRRRLLFLEELLFYRSRVYIDLPVSGLQELLTLANPATAKDPLFCLYLHKLKAQGVKLGSCAHYITDYRTNNWKAIDVHDLKPDILMLDVDATMASTIGRRSGTLCFPKQFGQISEWLIEVMLEQYNPGQLVDFSGFFNRIASCHCAVLEDPYFFQQPFEDIETFIAAIFKHTDSEIGKTLTIITNSDSVSKEALSLLKKKFEGVIAIEHYTRKFLHDRNLFTNAYWISADYGFMGKYVRAATKWTSHPLGRYCGEQYRRLHASVRFIKHEPQKSGNLLVQRCLGG